MENYPENRITPQSIDKLSEGEVFVFGSNSEGKHTGGAARIALNWGAEPGEGIGLFGQTYAIPTMFSTTRYIKIYVNEFIEFAKEHPSLKFLVTEIGCGIAGFKMNDIAPLFKDAVNVENIHLPKRFWEAL
jgi:hypothetical protein